MPHICFVFCTDVTVLLSTVSSLPRLLLVQTELTDAVDGESETKFTGPPWGLRINSRGCDLRFKSTHACLHLQLALEKLAPNFSFMHNIILKIQSGIVNWLFCT